MKKIFLWLFILIPLFIFFTEIDVKSAKMDFSVGISQPDNQINKDLTYFDLLVTPSQSQELELTVTNLGKAKGKFQITPTNAITNTHGYLDYSTQDNNFKYDASLKNPFTTLISEKQVVEIAPGDTAQITFKLNAPKEKFEGIILGAFVIEELDKDGDNNDNKNLTFINKFEMIKAVQIRSDETLNIQPDFKLADISPALYSYRTAVTANLQNTSPFILKDVKIKADICKSNNKKVLKTASQLDVEMAPNSNYDFPISWNNEPLESGAYSITMTVEYGGEKFEFTDDFNISKADSYQINEEAIELETKTNYTYLYIIGSLFIFIIISTFTLIIIKKKKNNKKTLKKSSQKKRKRK